MSHPYPNGSNILTITGTATSGSSLSYAPHLFSLEREKCYIFHIMTGSTLKAFYLGSDESGYTILYKNKVCYLNFDFVGMIEPYTDDALDRVLEEEDE